MRFAAVVVVTAWMVVSPAARADIAPDTFHGGSGLQIDPAQPDATALAGKIQMKKERVTITLHQTPQGAFAVVDAAFSMSGPPGKAAALKIAFPGQGVRVGGAFVVHPPLIGFRAFVDGKPVAVHVDEKTHTSKSGPPGREYSRSRTETWHGFPAAVDDDTTIRVRYAVAAAGVRDSDGADVEPWASVSYILHTGALWAGDIGEAVVEVKAAPGVDLTATSLRTLSMPPVSLVSLKGDGPPPPVVPAGAVRSGAAITWTAQHLEPTPGDDVEVVFPGRAGSWGAPSAELAALMAAAVR